MPNPNPELRAQISQYSDGIRTAQQIAVLVGKSRAYVQELVREMNLPRPARGTGAPRQRAPESIARIDQIKALADGLRTSEQIAQAVGSTPKYVQRILLEFDLPRLAQGPRQGKLNAQFAGGRRIDQDGYVFVSAPEGHPFAPKLPGKNIGRIYEHRLVMEKKLGRYLQPGEVVDHIDSLHLHNHPDNLRVFPSNSDHLRATISDQIPCWSAEGLIRIRSEPSLREALPQVDSYRSERARGDVRLRQILLALLSLGKDSPFLLGTNRWLVRAGIHDLSRSSLELHLQRVSPRHILSRLA